MQLRSIVSLAKSSSLLAIHAKLFYCLFCWLLAFFYSDLLLKRFLKVCYPARLSASFDPGETNELPCTRALEPVDYFSRGSKGL